VKKVYNAEIISVGTELLLGQITNTDSRDISTMLSKIGINVLYHTVVGDNPERMEKCIEIARSRVDIIITTGGLGPTCDDLTKMLLAKSFGLELKMDEDEKAGLYDYLTNKGIQQGDDGKQSPAGAASGGMHQVPQQLGHRAGLRL
jgi:nicotinamide-nucleotide amidase